jgi:oxygen-independent coproporphyrinogen-3 oxidase
MLPAQGPPGLYVHVPFCSAICPYCDFAVTRDAPVRHAIFVECLLAEISLWRSGWQGGTFDTVYFGGGTPSLLTPGELANLLKAMRADLPIAPGARISLEANPEDARPGLLATLRELGVRTLSLGVQSFDEEALKFLGRRHSPEEARRSVEAALAVGFDTVSIDLIFGLPEERQDLAALTRTLEKAVALGPQHVSCYQLTVHEGTPFGRGVERGVIRELPEGRQARAYERVVEVLTGAGYTPYEVSNFALAPEHRSRHNRKYWDQTPYLGLGPSAHSFDGRRRWWNERSLAEWSAKVAGWERPIAGTEALSEEDLALERVMLGLRTAAGVDLAGFEERFGVDLVAVNGELVEELTEAGLVVVEGGRLRPTVKGMAVADGLPAGFRVTREGGG